MKIALVLHSLFLFTEMRKFQLQAFPRIARGFLSSKNVNLSRLPHNFATLTESRGKIESSQQQKILINNAVQTLLQDDKTIRYDILRAEDDAKQYITLQLKNDQQQAVVLDSQEFDLLYPPLQHITKTKLNLGSIDAEKYSELYLQTHPWESKAYEYSVGNSTNNLVVGGLFSVLVDVYVVEGKEEDFITFTLHNCKNSLKESGVHRFDLLRDKSNPSHFVLVEIYNSESAPAKHKLTSHYKLWAERVAGLMAKPRAARKYVTVFPSPLDYHKSSSIVYDQDLQLASPSTETNYRGLSAVQANSFSFLAPNLQIGRGIAAEAIQSTLKTLGAQKPFIITGKSGLRRYKQLLDTVFAGVQSDYQENSFCIDGEPTVEQALTARDKALNADCDVILAIGGGSSLDLGKAVAALVTNNHRDIFDFLEVIGKGQAIEKKPLPLIAVPTTSGTGSEVTKNTVLKSVQHRRKVSMRHHSMLPSAAIVDPMLTITCPKSVTAHVGMDALCQVLEPFLCNTPNPITDALAKEGIHRAARSLRDVVRTSQESSSGSSIASIEAREDLAIASVLGGLCLANAKLGTVHGFAAVLGGLYEDAPHGAICAALLPYVFEANVQQLERIIKLKPDENAVNDAILKLARFREASRLLTNNPNASTTDGMDWLHALLRDINIPPLSTLCAKMNKDDFEEIATATMQASSTKGNPVQLSKEALIEILRRAM